MMLAILTDRERRRLGMLLVALTVMAGIEVVGVSSILPFLAVAAKPDTIFSNHYLNWVYDKMGTTTTNQFLILLGVAAVCALILRNGFHAITQYLLVRFTAMRKHALSSRLFAKYLRKDYVYFLDHNSASLSRNILTEATQVVRGILVPCMDVAARGIASLAIVLLLVVVNPQLAIVSMLVLGGLYTVIYLIVRRKLASSGKERLVANTERFKTAAEAFGGIKDVKLLGKETVFLRKYAQPSKAVATSEAYNELVGNFPKFVLETVTFGGIIAVVLYLLVSGGTMGEALPIIGLYAIAGYRLMPSLRSLFTDVATVRFNRTALEVLYRDLTELNQESPRVAPKKRITPSSQIEFRDVSFTYPNTSIAVIHNQTLRIEANTTVGLVGATGCGKTTVVDILLGLLKPERGSLLVDGVEIGPHNLSEWQASLGYVPQTIYLSDDTMAKNIAFGIPEAEIDPKAVERAARTANLHDFVVNELPKGYDSVIGERGIRLSGGQRQRIGIARAVYHEPAVLVLDEATSSLDGITESAVIEAIAGMAHSKTIIMIAHRLTTVKDCDLIYLLEKGRVVAHGTYARLMERSTVFRRMARQGR
jgi:ABC-type multidrug transport system fused ATPase/permease subunit